MQNQKEENEYIQINATKLKKYLKRTLIVFGCLFIIGTIIGAGFGFREFHYVKEQVRNEKGELIIYDIALRSTCNEYSELHFKAKALNARCKLGWIEIHNASVPLGLDPTLFIYYFGNVSVKVPKYWEYGSNDQYTTKNDTQYYEFNIGVRNIPIDKELLIIIKYNKISENAKMYLCVVIPDVWYSGW